MGKAGLTSSLFHRIMALNKVFIKLRKLIYAKAHKHYFMHKHQ
uniref:Uncharacterized protein n=1 Tax=Pseudoalteromonas luteoviolacea TaxID=43657 RepID=A0A023PZ12_9GAMM|nr:hypothetical protein [Pseudoalteromonas luteoviolacea]